MRMKFSDMIDGSTAAALRDMVGLPDPKDTRLSNVEMAKAKRGDRWAVMWSVHVRGADRGCYDTQQKERTFRCERFARAFAARIAYRTRYHGITVEHRPGFRSWDAVFAGECG